MPPKFTGSQFARIEGREYGLGFQPYRDPRNWMAYESPLRVEASERTSRYWHMGSIRLDQNGESSCVGYSGAHLLANGPDTQSELEISNDFGTSCYREAQKRDPWPNEDYEGSSVSGFAKYAKEQGWISEYFWCYDIETLVNMVLERGPVQVGTTWTRCVTPDQRVLTTDLRWIPAGKLAVGDAVIGFTGLGRESRFAPALVLSNHTIVEPTYEIVTDKGTVKASEDHRFIRCWTLGPQGGKCTKQGRAWVKTSDLKIGDRLAYWLPPFEEDTSWEAGWLAGFYDGEGSLGNGGLAAVQVVGPTLDRLRNTLAGKGFDTYVKIVKPDVTRQERATVIIRGKDMPSLRLLGSMRPSRLLPKAGFFWEGRRTYNKSTCPAEILEIRPLGRQEVNAVGTSTHTLLTEGFLSHNSMFNSDANGVIKVNYDSGIAGGHAYLINGVSRDADYGLGKTGYFRFQNSWGAAGSPFLRGSPWGYQGKGYGRIAIEDMVTLLEDDGEALIATEL